MTPNQTEEINTPVKIFRSVIQSYNETIITEKALKYDIGDIVQNDSAYCEKQSYLFDTLSDIQDTDDSISAEFDLNKSIQNTFKRRLLRRSTKKFEQFNISE
jgi:hypothetical protein